MNVLFITLLDIRSIHEHNIYCDLMRKFMEEGHNVYIVSPIERRNKMQTYFVSEEKAHILKLKTGNIQKTNIIEKGISTVLLEHQLKRGIIKYFGNVKIDLVLYSTPPITLIQPIKYIKKRDKAVTYLMLKDIFPQNAVDMGMLSKKGIKGVLYRYFRRKERKLYEISDYIGCMSEANMKYILTHNSELIPDKIEICPNCIEPSTAKEVLTEVEKKQIRQKYEIPLDKKVFVYGGNLGRPQGIDFVIECVMRIEQLEHTFVLIVGSGTEFDKLSKALNENCLRNTKLIAYMPKEEYSRLLQVCHVGLIFLDHRFTIPNFPSRLLAYMDARIPVFAAVDEVTDVGRVIEEGDFGWTCGSKDAGRAVHMIDDISRCDEIDTKGENGRIYLESFFSVETSYDVIMSHYPANM